MAADVVAVTPVAVAVASVVAMVKRALVNAVVASPPLRQRQ